MAEVGGLKKYRSDCWDEGNMLTRFVDYYHKCPLCGEEVESVNSFDETELCCDCIAFQIEGKLFLEWFQLIYREDIMLWVRYGKQFTICGCVYFMVSKNIL